VITPEAQLAFERAVALDAGFAKARFYLARLKAQNGDNASAYQALMELVATLPPGAAQARVSEEIARFHAEGKAPAGSKPPASAEAIASLPAQEQAAMIRSMVDGLTTRLTEQGGTAEEWLRLITARMVLGEKDVAMAHLTEAKTRFKADAATLERLNQLERAINTANPEQKPNLEQKP
jgi:cytochrome c-type biogenesis protein CcmH